MPKILPEFVSTSWSQIDSFDAGEKNGHNWWFDTVKMLCPTKKCRSPKVSVQAVQITTATQDSSPQRDTWYTPPKGTTFRQPVRLVSAVPRSLNAKPLSVIYEFGWAFDGEVWRNLNLGISMSHSPHENDF
ncbi:hypothetical protein PHYBLDRAFT_142449 [Phycomyces blakesleeanus NRRL 1555(-)]|uniref:Uncharacterized protein n=1 Tax=Phycomyces blakesleeanus (strain ATCC 8743b / DSM 1359 / FGSC 10004 / NBRC 33097 / NRRL 1555) TaxID=763407 RepID=A0A167NZE1_PHYB8|nr:hypothetical protein PHYBLDRAFT_142449 [Phycomyces blakesleeanus NRRL 1555(-)]OAD76941.1 hypothetical protein PHYBLDRAFT_142449 [Phycomyces blakesleeanus NRRL 1555(-)]|eukprot:XP_018294981.1 hypothetical protein PHYBLDRAFT_142449 [Phycomyces blakesleeanus NRRL 1555(-)]